MATDHEVWASSFADPKDIEGFRRAKARGLSDDEAFEFGDNGIGLWMDDVSEGSGPQVALPPEVLEFYWGATADNHWREARGKEIYIYRDEASAGQRWIVKAKISDRMPHIATLERKNRKYRIDLNPDTYKALGLTAPVESKVTWHKVEDREATDPAE